MARSIDPPASDAAKKRAGQNIDLLVELLRRHAETMFASAEAREVKSVGIIGAGVMGVSIAAVTIGHDLPVVITDARPEVLAEAPAKIAAALADQSSPPGTQQPEAIGRLIQPTDDLAAIGRCDLILEAVVEDPWVKQEVFTKLEPKLGSETILVTNTSTIPIGWLAARLTDPGRFCGLHFFHPLHRHRLVEIIRGPQSDQRTIAAAAAFARAIGQMPLVVDDGPGFLVNRLMLLYLSEAQHLLLEGVKIEAIERAATDFGMAAGPMRLVDEIGLDTVLQCGWRLSGALPDRVALSPVLAAMIKTGRLGRKSGAGFFRYADDEPEAASPGPDPEVPDPEVPDPEVPDPEVEELIARWALKPREHSSETITARLILPMLLEATRILEEKRDCDPRYIDLAVVFGFGFPASRGGLLYWADTLGATRILEMVKPLESLGPRARPTPMLLEMARKKRRFYDEATSGAPGDNPRGSNQPSAGDEES